MKAKSNFFTILVCSMVIAAVTAGLLFIHYGAKDIAYEQYKAHNNCPYEGYECPNAQAAIAADSIAYRTSEHIIDSLSARIIQLETQLAGYEFSNHSKITKAGITHIIRDERGLISVEFKSNGKDYALDYLTDAEFQDEFGFSVSK